MFSAYISRCLDELIDPLAKHLILTVLDWTSDGSERIIFFFSFTFIFAIVSIMSDFNKQMFTQK